MSSLFSPRPAQTRPRAISNGGLGGLVNSETISNGEKNISESGKWPKGQKRRPPPIQICHNNDNLLVPAPQWSAISCQSSREWTPRTPASIGSTGGQITAICSHQLTPLMSRFNSAGLHSLPNSNPVTPGTTKLPVKVAPIELAGSLLLPSQGFPPPPATPPRPIAPRRSDTDDSELSSAPSLSSSITNSSFSDNMDLLRGLSTPHWKPSSVNGVTGTNGSSNNKTSTVSKPFSAMSIEELLASLPNCDANSVARIWLPEMQRRYSKLKDILQKSQQRNIMTHSELKDIGNDLKAFTHEARVISNTYERALRSAESLIERDTLTLQERLHVVEAELKKCHAQSDHTDALLLEKEDLINRLDHTLNEVVRILGAFIQNNVAHWVQDFYNPETQAVMQVISDYGSPTSDRQVRYIRIPESSHLELLSALGKVDDEIQNYRAIAKGQDAIVKAQSKQLDEQLEKYEQSLKVIKSRDHEVLILDQRNSDLQEKVDSYEKALQRLQQATADRDQLKEQNEGLVQEMKRLTDLFAKQIQEKQSNIADLRQQLGSAREEVLARRADVRNVITQTQAMLMPYPHDPDTNRKGAAAKSPKTFGKSKDKDKDKNHKRSNFPHSHSSFLLGFQHLNPDLVSSPNSDSRFSSKEVIGCDKTGFHLSCGASSSSSIHTQSSTPTQRSRERPASDPFSDARQVRNESLNVIERDGVPSRSNGNNHVGGAATVDVQKQLPAPPTILARVPASSPLHAHPLDSPHKHGHPTTAPSTPKSQSQSQSQSLSPRVSVPEQDSYTPTPTLRSPARRVLSLIPEASVEDAESQPRTPSATSSDREVYRRSIHALDLLNGSSTVGSELAGDGEGSATERAGAGVAAEGEGSNLSRSSSSEGSEVLTVSQMYHDTRGKRREGGQGHLRS